MKIQSINNQSNVSHKAYFKPNAELKKLFSREIKYYCQLSTKEIDTFTKLPNHELEITEAKSISLAKVCCNVFNNRTKRANEYVVSEDCGLSDLMSQINKDTVLFDEYPMLNSPAKQYRRITVPDFMG